MAWIDHNFDRQTDGQTNRITIAISFAESTQTMGFQ